MHKVSLIDACKLKFIETCTVENHIIILKSKSCNWMFKGHTLHNY